MLMHTRAPPEDGCTASGHCGVLSLLCIFFVRVRRLRRQSTRMQTHTHAHARARTPACTRGGQALAKSSLRHKGAKGQRMGSLSLLLPSLSQTVCFRVGGEQLHTRYLSHSARGSETSDTLTFVIALIAPWLRGCAACPGSACAGRARVRVRVRARVLEPAARLLSSAVRCGASPAYASAVSDCAQPRET